MAPTKQEVAQQFLRRREKNLRYFQKTQPALFKHFQAFRMSRVEVQVGTEGEDVDLVVDGQSWYQGRARALGKEEARQFLEEYPSGKVVESVVPPFAGGKNAHWFTAVHQNRSIEHSPVTRENFGGFKLSNFLPSVVFMGVGLGYHIEAVTQKVDVVDGIIFEPDDEVFAASLFTVDWESVCQRFLGRKGYSLRFLITPADWTDQQLQELLEGEVQKSVPLFPVMTSYFNHRGQTRFKTLAQSIAQDTAAHLTSWGGYDDEIRRLNNMLHNTRQAVSLLSPKPVETPSLPVLIVGSGPSIDQRMEQIKRVRSQVILVSAGTGIRALIANGLAPDFHLELDPKYSVYGHLSALDSEAIKHTTLLAVAEINPMVPGLFQNSLFFAKDRSPYPGLFGIQDHAFRFCYPTCTNAALSLFVQLGFTEFFLLGCDYGFKSLDNHHSESSVYGKRDTSEISRALKEYTRSRYQESRTFMVEGVEGEPVYTKADYHSARKEMEKQVRYWKAEKPGVRVNNCSDGALIEGVPWMGENEFLSAVQAHGESATDPEALRTLIPATVLPADLSQHQVIIEEVSSELRRRGEQLAEALSRFPLRGKKDISRASRQVSAVNHKVSASASQRTASHLLSGTIKWFLLTGFSHAMAHEDEKSLASFLGEWQKQLKNYLAEVPVHCEKALSQGLPASEDPLVTGFKWDSQTELVNVAPED